MVVVESRFENSTNHEDISNLHPETNLGHVHLTITDLARSIEFYERALGFTVQDQSGE